MSKGKKSTKKIKKKIRGYRHAIGKHHPKIAQDKRTGDRAESIPHMTREVKALTASLEKEVARLDRR
ncbi:MAG: hypothetical protein V3R93_01745, partial [Candidatus Hydrothermarchaeaceae archaeon]